MNYEEIYTKYYGAVYRFVAKKIQHHEDTEDIVQETFTRAYAHWSKVDERRGRITSWLFTIAFNIVRDRYRKLRLYASLNVDDCILYAPDELTPVEQRDEAERLLALLPEQRRKVFYLLADGCSFIETAGLLNKTYGATKVNARRDRRVMAAAINGASKAKTPIGRRKLHKEY